MRVKQKFKAILSWYLVVSMVIATLFSNNYYVNAEETGANTNITGVVATDTDANIVSDENIDEDISIASEEATNVVTAKVDITAQAYGGFLMAPLTGVYVSSDLAETYGFTDKVEGKVSALDVLVKVHEEIFGEVEGYLAVSESGWITTIFGDETMSNGFAINGETTYTTIDQTEINNNDKIEFWIYQDSSYLDSYVNISEDGTDSKIVNTISLTAGEKKDFYVRGYAIAYGKEWSSMTEKEGLTVAKVNMSTGELTDIPGCITDENGKMSLCFDTPGSFNITLYDSEGVEPVVMHLFSVNVKEAEVTDDGTVKEPVALPTDDSKITHIKSVNDLSKANFKDKNAVYVLDNDITIGAGYYIFDSLSGIFDGQGHTITFDNPFLALFYGVEETGVVQNVYFTGNISSAQGPGPVGYTLKGTIVNCYSDVTGNAAAGFAKTISGGQLINCYSVSTAKNGVLFKQGTEGLIKNVYWLKGSKNQISSSVEMVDSGELEAADMKTKEFVAKLNKNKGKNGVSWGQSSEGYPYFGEDAGYEEDEKEAFTNKYVLKYQPQGTNIKIEQTENEMTVAKEDASALGFYGTFMLEDVPEGSKITWQLFDVLPDKCVMIGEDSGELYVYKEGTGKLIATETKEDGSIEKVAEVNIRSVTKEMTDIKIYIDENEVKDGFTVSGSEWKDIAVKALYEGETEYVNAPLTLFTYEVGDEDYIKSMGYNSFYFKKPGTSSITIASKNNSAISKTINITSKYVAVESVVPAISGTKILHGRNANSQNGTKYIPDIATVIVTPENASYRDDFTIKSSNPEVAEYVDSMIKGYVPSKAGKVTFTAEIKDKDKTVKGSSEVTYIYQNPLKEIIVNSNEITMKNNTEEALSLEFIGEKSSEGYSITEPGIIWTFDKEGIVKIEQSNPGWKRDESAPDNNMWLSQAEYTVSAIGEGTVIATGTPIDDTATAEKITVKITVEAGDAEAVDVDAIVNKIQTGITGNIKKSEYSYGDEWVIYELLRSGDGITENEKQTYLASVKEAVKGWKETTKVTDIERTALTLMALGEDITDFNGVNIAEKIYNNKNLGRQGANGYIWALLAFDAGKFEIPKDAVWTREKIVTELLKYQKEDGGFGLNLTGASGVDITAMALQSLAKYKGDKNVKNAVDKGINYLKKQQKADFGYGDNLESAAQVLMALSMNGINPTSNSEGFGTQNKNIITFMDSYYLAETGEFKHIINGKGNGMATIQGLQAMSCYKLNKNGSSYWDLTDILGSNSNENVADDKKPNNDNKPSDGNAENTSNNTTNSNSANNKPSNDNNSAAGNNDNNVTGSEDKNAEQALASGHTIGGNGMLDISNEDESDKKDEGSITQIAEIEGNKTDTEEIATDSDAANGWEFAGEDYVAEEPGDGAESAETTENEKSGSGKVILIVVIALLIIMAAGIVWFMILKRKNKQD